MATIQWIGDAAAQAQINRVLVLSTQEGATCRVTINGKTVRYTVSAAVAGSKSGIAAALSTAVSGLISDNASLAGITVSSALDDAGATIGIDVTGKDDGTPFTFAIAGAVIVTVAETVKGRAGKNNKQLIVLPGVPTGGTFTLPYFGQTTAATAYNASAATVTTNLEALSTIGTGNITVTGSAGGPWTAD